MKPALFLAVAMISLLAANSSLAADELCRQMNSFEQKPLAKLPDGELQRRWMDFSWGDAQNLKENEVQFGVTLKCSGSDEVAKTLCQYVLHHSSIEFFTALPLAMLRCRGFVSTRKAFPSQGVEDLSWDVKDGLTGRFQIDQLDRPGHEPSMRLSIIPYPESPQTKKPEPFFKALSAKLGRDVEGED